MKSFQDKVCVVTGAGSGIGRALAMNFASRGARLALSDINEENLQETADLLNIDKERILLSKVDVSQSDELYRYADEVAKHFNRVDVLVNNAGVTVSDSFEETSKEDFEWVMDINFWGVVHGSKAFLPYLRRSPEAALVNISSIFGLIGFPYQGAYNASKFAVRGFTEALRLELSDSSVSPISVHPGGIRTNIVKNARFKSNMLGGDSQSQMIQTFDKYTLTTPEKAAQTIVRGIEKSKKRVLIGPDAWVVDSVARLLPNHYERLLTWLGKAIN